MLKMALGLHRLACSSCLANFLCSCCTRVCLGGSVRYPFKDWELGCLLHIYINKYSLDPWNLHYACQPPSESWSNLGKLADEFFWSWHFHVSPVWSSLGTKQLVWTNTLFTIHYIDSYSLFIFYLKFEPIHYSVNSKVSILVLPTTLQSSSSTIAQAPN